MEIIVPPKQADELLERLKLAEESYYSRLKEIALSDSYKLHLWVSAVTYFKELNELGTPFLDRGLKKIETAKYDCRDINISEFDLLKLAALLREIHMLQDTPFAMHVCGHAGCNEYTQISVGAYDILNGTDAERISAVMNAVCCDKCVEKEFGSIEAEH